MNKSTKEMMGQVLNSGDTSSNYTSNTAQNGASSIGKFETEYLTRGTDAPEMNNSSDTSSTGDHSNGITPVSPIAQTEQPTGKSQMYDDSSDDRKSTAA